MNEVIGYVDVRAEEVAAAKADDVLEPAEQAKDDAIAAKEAAEQARDTTLAALPQIQQDITDLKAEDVALDGRLDTVELKVTTAEGNIVTIQGRVTAVETKNNQQDSAIAALQTADGQNVKLTGTHAIGNYAVLLTGNQEKTGQLISLSEGGFQVKREANYSIAFVQKNTGSDRDDNTQIRYIIPLWIADVNDKQMMSLRYNKINKTHRVFIRIVDSTGVEHDTIIAQYDEP